MTIFSENLRGWPWPFWPHPGYAYVRFPCTRRHAHTEGTTLKKGVVFGILVLEYRIILKNGQGKKFDSRNTTHRLS